MNVATGGRTSLNQLLASLQKLLGTSLTPIFERARAGDVRDSQASIARAEQVLGYQPTVSFEDGLAATVEWYRTAQAAPSSLP
jgi:nucleoside-diphosphate-sugar epimerase